MRPVERRRVVFGRCEGCRRRTRADTGVSPYWPGVSPYWHGGQPLRVNWPLEGDAGMLIVVAYDVADDRRRTRLHTLLHAWGTPVQESVFECEVDERQEREMKRLVRRSIRKTKDRVNFYPLCQECVRNAEDGAGVARVDGSESWVV